MRVALAVLVDVTVVTFLIIDFESPARSVRRIPEEERWSKEGKEETERLSPVKQARRLVHKAKLMREEVLAIRLWSGPMYCSYSNVLRNGLKGQFMVYALGFDTVNFQ